MSWQTFTHRLRALVWRRRLEQELDQELEFHRAMAAEHGGPHRFGNELRLREQTREAWMFGWVEALGQDLRFAVRGIRHAPGFAAAVVIALALGVGANSAIFSLAYAVLWQPLPYPEASRTVVVEQHDPKFPRVRANSSLDISLAREQSVGLTDWSMYRSATATLTGAGSPALLEGAQVEAGVLTALGVKPVAGRLLLRSDDRPDAPPTVMISDQLWQQRWHASPEVIGKQIEIDGKGLTVVGVLPGWFHFPVPNPAPPAWKTVFWRAYQSSPEAPGNRDVQAIARLAPGATLSSARAHLAAVMVHLSQKYEDDQGYTFILTPLRQFMTAEVAAELWLMLAVVALVLLIAGANVACLLSARTQRRAHELATRAALGASRGRITRQLLTEAAVLIALGLGVGLAFALAGITWLRSAAPASMPLLAGVSMNWPVAGFAAVTAIFVMLAFGLPPAWSAMGPRLDVALRPARSTRLDRTRGRSAWVIAQVALSLLLLVGAGLLLSAFVRMRRVRLGFNPDHVLSFTLMVPSVHYATFAQKWHLFEESERRLAALPGVEAAAVVGFWPPNGQVMTFYSLPRKPLKPGDPTQMVGYNEIGTHYLATLQIPVVRGRSIGPADTATSPPVAVISQEAARTIFSGRDPIGQRIRFTFGSQPWRTIVGVVGDTRYQIKRVPAPPVPMAYVPIAQAGWLRGSAGFVLRTRIEPLAILPEIRRAVAAVDPQAPVAFPMTLTQIYSRSLAQPRFRGWLVAGFGLLGLLLTSVGIFGVLAYSVGGRTQEMGVRSALGARPDQMLGMILMQALRLVVAGLVIGLGLAMLLTRYLRALLYGVSPTNGWILGGVAALMVLVALAAAWLPARRAMRVDPAQALRCE